MRNQIFVKTNWTLPTYCVSMINTRESISFPNRTLDRYTSGLSVLSNSHIKWPKNSLQLQVTNLVWNQFLNSSSFLNLFAIHICNKSATFTKSNQLPFRNCVILWQFTKIWFICAKYEVHIVLFIPNILVTKLIRLQRHLWNAIKLNNKSIFFIKTPWMQDLRYKHEYLDNFAISQK